MGMPFLFQLVRGGRRGERPADEDASKRAVRCGDFVPGA
jgi:hypothetical protein